MNKARIIELVGTIPRKSKIYAEVKEDEAPSIEGDVQIHRRACALLDPAFPWKYAEAFAQLRQPLPEIVDEHYIRAAHDHLSGSVIHDEINEAQVLQHGRWVTKRGFLEALLLLPNLRLDEIAAHAGLTVPVVMAYETLFWNVRDRRDDAMFVNELCLPNTRLNEYRDDYWVTVQPRDLMLRAAYNNDLPTILQIFGTRAPAPELPADVSAKRVKARIMADAEFVIRAGGSSSGLPVLDAARRIIAAGEKNVVPKRANGDDVIGLTALSLSIGDSIMANLRGSADDSEYNARLAKQDAERAEGSPATN
jgi:hypothetical protein